MLTLTYEYKLDPTTEQASIFDNWLETCRKVYNYALRERKDWVNSRKSAINACSIKQEYILPADEPRPTYARQCKALAAAKKVMPNLCIPHTHVLQQALRQLEAAFVAMWERGHGISTFQEADVALFVYPQLNQNPVRGSMIRLPKIGLVKMRLSRPIPDGFELKQIRIVKRASGFYAMLCLQSEEIIPELLPSGHPVGIDLGLSHFLATSDGELVARPRFF
ncbi:MAG: transposase, partial [Pseudanabaena sp. CRU_2_10]|nr:transposase [Pseudanabaena sp. CRU_2_10]